MSLWPTTPTDLVTTQLTRLPTTDQIALMDENYSAGSVISDTQTATVGMFGMDAEVGFNDDYPSYFFYLKFQPADDFCATTTARTFRMLF